MDVAAEIQKVLRAESRALERCASRLDSSEGREAAARAVEILRKCLDGGGKIIVTGIGKSGKVGEKIAATLSSTGSLAVFLHAAEALHGDLGIARPGDCVLAVSYSGSTQELLGILPTLRSMDIPVIGMGGNQHSPLASKCDVWIDAAVEREASPENLVPTASTSLALALGDALAVALMQVRGFKLEDFARNHPGGALGKKLNLKVADVMFEGDEVPVLPVDAPVDQVIMAATDKKLGGVLVVEKGTRRLAGLITEGDIRRALKHREKFFGMSAGDVMTRNPVTVSPGTLASEALRLMEDRDSQISVLPVVDGKGDWAGIIRLHDLVRNL